tara:strand:- start:118 stop:318 length:201 start_codon:yes stop_codon:yes gene_type:complete
MAFTSDLISLLPKRGMGWIVAAFFSPEPIFDLQRSCFEECVPKTVQQTRVDQEETLVIVDSNDLGM